LPDGVPKSKMITVLDDDDDDDVAAPPEPPAGKSSTQQQQQQEQPGSQKVDDASTSKERGKKETYLSGEPSKPSKLSMLRVTEKPAPTKIVDLDDAKDAGKDGAFDLEEDEPPSLLDELYEDARIERLLKEKKRELEEKRMKKGFGGGLKKGFFGSSNGEKKKKNKGEAKTKKETAAAKQRKGDTKEEKESSPSSSSSSPSSQSSPSSSSQSSPSSSSASLDLPTIRPDAEKDIKQQISDEALKKMRDDIRLDEEAKKEWLNTELLEEMMKRPRLARGMRNPAYAAAIEKLRTEPDAYKDMMYEDEELRLFVHEFCDVMGKHFNGLADKEFARRDERAKEKVARELGPLAADVYAKSKQKDGPRLAANEEEQKQVDAVLNDPQLKKLLTNPDTQALLQRCNDPHEFNAAMRNPDTRAVLELLAHHGLVQIV